MNLNNAVDEGFDGVKWAKFLIENHKLSSEELKSFLGYLKIAFEEGQTVGWRQGYRDA
jgi:hypothetical protein